MPTVLIVCACLRQYTPDGAVHKLAYATDGVVQGSDVSHYIFQCETILEYIEYIVLYAV